MSDTPITRPSAPAPPSHVAVAIVGAGFAGIGMALELQRRGIDDVVLLERAPSVGGTWRDNTYPGVACDVPSHLYGFAAHPNPAWSRVFAPGGEIHSYLEDVVTRQGLDGRVRLRTPVLAASWDAAAELWRITTGGARPGTLTADALVLACGRLTEPRVPDVPGLESFPGPLFHTARWDHDVDLTGLRVGVVGTGASAVQLVPELAKTSTVTLFQRTPAWIVPRGERAYSPAERAAFADDPAMLSQLRDALFEEGEERFAARSGDEQAAAAARTIARVHLETHVDDPALRAALTPDYAFGCKRVLLSDTFYPAIASAAVTLEPSALASVDGRTLVAASGARHDVDALVLATGFASTQQPYAELVVGADGQTLAEHWGSGMTSFASTVVSGFPNMFVLNGPNASLGHNSSVLMVEEQAAYVSRALERSAGGVLRVDPAAEQAYTAQIDAAAASTPWITGGCRNWYVDERSGRLTLLWPGTVRAFRDRLAEADGSEFLTDASGPRRWTVTIPVKPTAIGKSRLEASPTARAELARAIALDTIAATIECPDVDRVIVVTDDAEVAREARSLGAEAIPEGTARGLDAAVATGAERAGLGAARAALLGDVPALRAADLSRALRAAASADRAVVADAEGTGSTLVTARAGVPWVSAFGDGSFARHVGLGCHALPIAGDSTLRRDVDTADQLRDAGALGLGPRTGAAVAALVG